MNLNKKQKQLIAAVSALVLVVIVSAVASPNSVRNSTTTSSSLNDTTIIAGEGMTAGATTVIADAAQSKVFIENDLPGETGEVQRHGDDESNVIVDVLQEADNEVDDAEESVDSEWENKLMADVDDNLSVRIEPEADAALTGRLRKGDVAEVVEMGEDWIKIVSGKVEGFVNADYCVVGADAKTLSEEDCELYVISETDGLRIRKEASHESSIVDMIAENDKVLFDEEAKEVDGWVAVKCDNKTGYIKSDYVRVERVYGTGISIEEEQAIKAAERAAEAAKKAGNSGKTRTQRSSVSASVDDITLLAALIQCEAGTSNYEGMLAVGAVVCNRVRRGYGGGTIRGVIYQSGQFPPAVNGKVDNVLARGVSGACKNAAAEAIAGYDNTGGAVNFRPASSGHGGIVIGGNVYF